MEGTLERRFESLVADNQAALLRLCAGYERDAQGREDLFQEILLAIWRGLPSLRDETKTRTWLLTVAHNVSCRHVGRAVRSRRSKEAPAEWVHSQPASEPGEELDGRRAAELMGSLIRDLGSLDRQIILLYLEDLPQGEIAEITGLTRDNVSTRVHRIKAALAAAMDGRAR